MRKTKREAALEHELRSFEKHIGHKITVSHGRTGKLVAVKKMKIAVLGEEHVMIQLEGDKWPIYYCDEVRKCECSQ